jgi:DNA gyrase subunit B
MNACGRAVTPAQNFGWNDFGIAEHIRRRPSMFLGDTRANGLHRLAYELVEYAITEFATGKCNRISVQINNNGSLTVDDNGLGIPIAMHSSGEMTILEWVMRFSTGVEIQQGGRLFLNSLHGAGARVVTALSDWTEALVSIDRHLYRQKYERGNSVGDVSNCGPADGRTGTTITFHPDPEIFADSTFDWNPLAEHLRELAFLNQNLTTQLCDMRARRTETFHYPGGVADFVECLNRGAQVLHKPFLVEKTVDDVHVEIALQFTTGKEQKLRSYANNAYNRGGGTHQLGFHTTLTRMLKEYAYNENLLRIGPSKTDQNFREGLTAIVSVKLPSPQFESQSKYRLNNPEVESIVADIFEEAFTVFLKENEVTARRIIMNVAQAPEFGG